MAFILRHTIQMYASTKGTRIDTQLITVSVNSDDELLAIDSDDCGSILDAIYAVWL